jgi:AcrR family transcriptional regulator
MARRTDTRQKLLDAGMRLFAERGFDATSVADLEEAVGLKPRRGSLYKHFATKEELLDAAVRRHLDDADAIVGGLESIDPDAGDNPDSLHALMVGLARVFLAEMDRLEGLTRLLEHDGRRLAAVTAEVKLRSVDLSYRATASLISVIAPFVEDPEATAVAVLGSLVALRRTAWTFGSPPLAIDDDRFLSAWSSLFVRTVYGG